MAGVSVYTSETLKHWRLTCTNVIAGQGARGVVLSGSPPPPSARPHVSCFLFGSPGLLQRALNDNLLPSPVQFFCPLVSNSDHQQTTTAQALLKYDEGGEAEDGEEPGAGDNINGGEGRDPLDPDLISIRASIRRHVRKRGWRFLVPMTWLRR